MSSSLNKEESSRDTGSEDCNRARAAAEAASKTKNNHFGVLRISCEKERKDQLEIEISSYPYLMFV